MTETQTDTFEHGIGLTTLASERGAVDNIREDSPVAIHGVLIPENTVLEGGQGVRHFYTPQMAERAADILGEQIDNPDHQLNPLHLVKNFHEIEGQAPADDIIGEVTGVGYSPGVGVVFEAETTDVETAQKIGNGYLQVSPTTARGLGPLDDQMEAREVTDFAGARDVAIVGRGQPGVEVNVGPNPAVDALALDALSQVFDGETDAATGSDDGDGSQSTDGPADGESTDDQPSNDTMSDENTLSDEEQALLAAVEDPSQAIDVLRDYSSREEPKIIDASNRAIIPSDELDTLRENVKQAKEAFAALLAEDSPLSVDALARSDMEALTEPFRDDDGDIDIDTLRQTPEVGDPEGGEDPEGDGDTVDFDTLSLGEREDIRRQVRKRESMLNRDMDKRAGEIEDELVDTLGAESFEDIAAELEAL